MRSLIVMSLVLLAGAASAEQIDGYRGDGSGIHADAKPPAEFNGSRPAWMVPLPSWGHSTPIVTGDRVFVTVEPNIECDWPQLVCLSLKDGSLLWQRTLSVAEVAAKGDKGRQKEIEGEWAVYRRFVKAKYRAIHDLADGMSLQKVKEKYADQGLDVDVSKGQDTNRSMRQKGVSNPKSRLPVLLHDLGMRKDEWQDVRSVNGIHAIGQAYPTPVTDGEFVYVVTGQGVNACYDFEGKLRWATHTPRGAKDSSSEPSARSPLLHGDLMLADTGNLVRALNRKTGKLLWSDTIWGATIATPDILEIDGQHVLYTAGPRAYLLPSGRKLKIEGFKKYGMQILVKHDEPDVAFFCGSGEHSGWKQTRNHQDEHLPPAAVRFSVKGDILQAEVLWHGAKPGKYGRSYGGNLPWMTYHDGKLFAPRDGAFDANKGGLLFGQLRVKQSVAAPDTRHYLQIADGRIYGMKYHGGTKKNGSGAKVEVFSLKGDHISTNIIPQEQPTTEELALIRSCTIHRTQGNPSTPVWSTFAYGMPFTFGPRSIIVRSAGRLYCFR